MKQLVTWGLMLLLTFPAITQSWRGNGTDLYFNSGDVGIGTASPTHKLHINGITFMQGDDSSDDILKIRGYGAASNGVILSAATGSNGTGSLRLRYYADDMLKLAAYGDSYIYGGNLGIGTKTPLKKLDVNGDVLFTGKLGIGTSSPGNKLDVAGGIDIDDYIRHNGDENTYLGFPSNDQIGLTTAGSRRMTIASNGYVGIGTSSPSHKLTVNGPSKFYYSSSQNNTTIESHIASSGTLYGLQVNATSTNTGRAVYGLIGLATSNYASVANTAVGVYGEASSPTPQGGFAGWFNGALGHFGLYEVSDERLKENIQALPDGLETIMRLKPKKFEYRKIEGQHFPKNEQTGFLAQDLKEVLPNLVKKSILPKTLIHDSLDVNTVNKQEEQDYLLVNYIGLIPFIIKSIQEQQYIIEQQQSAIDELIFINNHALKSSELIDNSFPHIIKIFPNPANNILEVQCFTNSLKATISIHNKYGDLMTNYEVEDARRISLESFQDGIYLLSLVIDGKVFDTKRFIISK